MKILLILLGLAGSAWFVFDLGSPSQAWSDGAARVTYYGNGERKAEIPYRDGVPDGKAREWYPDGRPASEGTYEDGQRNGRWTFWREDGTVDPERSGLYQGGRRVGEA
jgi:antitoxin component YwqK of YwqJK toxin-antitoxin module